MSHYLWDYDEEELKKTHSGRLKILERKINYGPPEGEAIDPVEVKKYWGELEENLFPEKRDYYKLLLWGDSTRTPRSRYIYL